MAVGTFEDHLKSDIDWVRLYIRDTADPFRVANQTIQAVLAASRNKWYAAAELFRISTMNLTDDTVITKIVDDLHITYGGKSTVTSFEDYYYWLMERGGEELLPEPKIFEVL